MGLLAELRGPLRQPVEDPPWWTQLPYRGLSADSTAQRNVLLLTAHRNVPTTDGTSECAYY